MAKLSKRTSLSVWMNGEKVGTWVVASAISLGSGSSFQYAPEWLAAPERRALSLSLPFTPGNVPHSGAVVTDFFDNLLPESDETRRRLRTRYGTASTVAFDLLSVIGRDCAGAVQLLREGETPKGWDRIEGTALDARGVERVIDGGFSTDPFTDGEHNLRVSLSGMQEKTALLFHKGQWWLPHGATPTTHIIKLPLGMMGSRQVDMSDSVENEWLCARIMNAFGLRTAASEIRKFGEHKVLIVERFDRRLINGRWIARLPQEDFCQALGIPAANKYESAGGPDIESILRVLDSSSRPEDKRDFVKAQIVFWLLAAIDGHGKNFSIFHERGGTYCLTPFYDVLSAWPIIGDGVGFLDMRRVELAMAVRGKNPHRKLEEIRPHHWDWAARLAGFENATAILEEVLAEIPEMIRSVSASLPAEFPTRISDAIFKGIIDQLERLGS
ncbi:MAG: type II toxin-antitoxin system HipA family toxin [Chthoniobacterales bacterium]